MSNEPVDFVDDADDDIAAEQAGDLALEEKYSKQMRQIHPQKIELPISTLRTMVEEQIKLNPEFQRRDRWDTKKQSRFVESIIMNVPVPPVFLGEDKYGSYVVLDGRQRLTVARAQRVQRVPRRGPRVRASQRSRRPQAPTADLSPDGGSAQAALPRRPWK
jgi:hypothetical protein